MLHDDVNDDDDMMIIRIQPLVNHANTLPSWGTLPLSLLSVMLPTQLTSSLPSVWTCQCHSDLLWTLYLKNIALPLMLSPYPALLSFHGKYDYLIYYMFTFLCFPVSFNLNVGYIRTGSVFNILKIKMVLGQFSLYTQKEVLCNFFNLCFPRILNDTEIYLYSTITPVWKMP